MSKTLKGLKADYDTLAAKCTKAASELKNVRAKIQAEVAKQMAPELAELDDLMKKKRDAFVRYHNALRGTPEPKDESTPGAEA